MRQDDDKKEEVDLGLLQVIAQENNVSDCCLRQAIIAKRLNSQKINGRVYCKRSDVKHYLSSKHDPKIKKSKDNEFLYPDGYCSPSHYKKFGLKPNLLYYAISSKKIPYNVKDGHYVLKESDIKDYLSAQSAKYQAKYLQDAKTVPVSQKKKRLLRMECDRSSL